MARIPGYTDGFNAEDVSPAGSYDPLPDGWYAALIDSSEVKQTKAGNGEYLALRFKIVEGDFENRTVFTNLNLVNPNAQAVEIARRTFSSICHAVGVLNPEDTSELHGIPMSIKIKLRPATDQYAASNDVTGFKALTEGDSNAPW